MFFMVGLTKFQVYQLIALLDLNGVRAGKGKDPSRIFDHVLEAMNSLDPAAYFGNNGPAGKNPRYPTKDSTWNTLKGHGIQLLNSWGIDKAAYRKIGAEYEWLGGGHGKGANGYTGRGFKHQKTHTAIQKGLANQTSLRSGLGVILANRADGFKTFMEEVLVRVGVKPGEAPPQAPEAAPKEVDAPAEVDEAMLARSLPSTPQKGVLLAKETAGKGMPIPPDWETARRRISKAAWDENPATQEKSIGKEKATVMVELFAEPEADTSLHPPGLEKTTPDIIVKFTVGEKPVFSTYVGDAAPLYPFDDREVTRLNIGWSDPANGPARPTKLGVFVGDYAVFGIDDNTITSGLKRVTGFEIDDFAGNVIRCPDCLEFGLLPQGEGGKGLGIEEDADYPEKQKKLYDDGGGAYYFKKFGKLFASPDIYALDKTADEEYLLPPDVNFDKISPVEKDEAVIFDLLIENPTFSTNNYTGRDSFEPRSQLVERLMFPGDDGMLAPMGTDKDNNPVECGKSLPEGRVLKSVKVARNDEGAVFKICLEFRDGSTAIFPDPESKTFSAVDKETGQLLKGIVNLEVLEVFKGSLKEKYANLMATRRRRNLNRDYNIIAADENMTGALAWRGGEQGEVLKVLVPDPDNPDNSVVITIPLMEV